MDRGRLQLHAAGSTESAAREYVDRAMESIPGWFSRVDAFVFRAVNQLQQEARVSGNILEIGSYLGRSAILLGHLKRSDELFFICDLFGKPPESVANEEENKRDYGNLALAQFVGNYMRHHTTMPEILVCSSRELCGRLKAQIGTFRFIHVDGSHLFELVRCDIESAKALNQAGGVVVFDDIWAQHAPGVAAAVWEAVANEGLIPVCLTAAKLYAVWDRTGPISSDSLAKSLEGIEGLHFGEHRMCGQRVLQVERIRSLSRRFVEASIPPIVLRKLIEYRSYLMRAASLATSTFERFRK
jgi:hypothetical protein